MSTLTLDHLSEPQRQALRGPEPSTNPFAQLSRRFDNQAALARSLGRPLAARTLQGYANLAADLAKPDNLERWNVADPKAIVPAALLAPDGRYSCDGCEGLVERAALTTFPHGFFCAECAQEQAP
jgi:hypothetical protein